MNGRPDDRTDDPTPRDDALRDALAEKFRAELAAAPPLPPALRRALGVTPPAPPRLAPARFVAAAAVVLVVAVASAFLFTSRAVDASPLAIVTRAAERHADLQDARVLFTLRSEAIELLEALLAKPPEPADEAAAAQRKGFAPRFLLLADRQSRFLLWEGDGSPRELEQGVPVTGFDGRQAWNYDATRGVAEAATGEAIADLESLALTRFLGFGFVRDLLREQDRFTIVETTGPFEERVGRRSFALDRPREAGEDDGPIWTRATLHIDPQRDLIERAELDVALGPLNLVRVVMETVAVNQGEVPARFALESNVPSGTRIVEAALEIDVAGEGVEPEVVQAAERTEASREEPPQRTPGAIGTRLGLDFAVLESKVRRSIISTDTPYGFKIQRVAPDSPAARAGLRNGDLVMRVDGEPFERVEQLEERLDALGKGGLLRLEISRKSGGRPSRSPWETFDVEVRLE